LPAASFFAIDIHHKAWSVYESLARECWYPFFHRSLIGLDIIFPWEHPQICPSTLVLAEIGGAGLKVLDLFVEFDPAIEVVLMSRITLRNQSVSIKNGACDYLTQNRLPIERRQSALRNLLAAARMRQSAIVN